MEISLESPFLLSKFVDKTKFPQELLFSSFTFCYEPIVYLVEFFSNFDKSNLELSSFPQVCIKNPESVYIGKNVEIDPFVYIEGPAWIGDGAKIKHSAYLRPYSFIGPLAVVGHASEIKNSILCEGAKAAHFNYVGDSLLGSFVNLGAGVKCANFKLDQGYIKLRTANEQLKTGQKKLGAIIGHNVSIGCNTVLSPGTMISPYTKIPPNTHVKGYVE